MRDEGFPPFAWIHPPKITLGRAFETCQGWSFFAGFFAGGVAFPSGAGEASADGASKVAGWSEPGAARAGAASVVPEEAGKGGRAAVEAAEAGAADEPWSGNGGKAGFAVEELGEAGGAGGGAAAALAADEPWSGRGGRGGMSCAAARDVTDAKRRNAKGRFILAGSWTWV